jgi:hypothetical protein
MLQLNANRNPIAILESRSSVTGIGINKSTGRKTQHSNKEKRAAQSSPDVSRRSPRATGHSHEFRDQRGKAAQATLPKDLTRENGDVTTDNILELKNHPQESGPRQWKLELGLGLGLRLEDSFSRQHNMNDQKVVQRQSTKDKKQIDRHQPGTSNGLHEQIIDCEHDGNLFVEQVTSGKYSESLLPSGHFQTKIHRMTNQARKGRFTNG